MKLSPDQQRAFDVCRRFLAGAPRRTPGPPDQLTLGGYAGTGKTHLIRELLTEFPDATVLTPTGKAAHVLRKKGVTQAGTIHSAMYTNVADPGDPPVFAREPAFSPDLVICDESSMIPTDVYNDLVEAAGRVLFVGDHGQLEPVGDNPRLMENPDVRLEKIHRQAAGNPIISLAHSVREGQLPPDIQGSDAGPLWVRPQGHADIPTIVEALDPSVVLTPWNNVRQECNAHGRALNEATDQLPQPGEPIIITRNNPEFHVFNGLCGEVVRCVPLGTSHARDSSKNPVKVRLVELTLKCDDDAERTLPCVDPRDLDTLGKHATPPPVFAERWRRANGTAPKAVLVEFAYALTAHKAQGSEWPAVLVMYAPSNGLWSDARWLYTAVTRASERLLVTT